MSKRLSAEEDISRIQVAREVGLSGNDKAWPHGRGRMTDWIICDVDAICTK